MKTILISAAAVSLALAGCRTTTTIMDPSSDRTGFRSTWQISSEEYRDVAAAAVEAALTNPKFINFLKKYREEAGDENAIPVLKLGYVVNDTDDPDLDTSELTELLNDALLNSGKVDITIAEGMEGTEEIANARYLAQDDNFDQTTTAKKGRIQAARILLRPKVISSAIRDGRNKVVTRTFVLEMADIDSGLLMWKFTKQLQFMKKKPVFGY